MNRRLLTVVASRSFILGAEGDDASTNQEMKEEEISKHELGTTLPTLARLTRPPDAFSTSKLPTKEATTIRFIERNNGDVFTFHGDDAVWVAQTIFGTTRPLKQSSSKEMYLPLSRTNSVSLLRDLLFKWGYKVEIWTSGLTLKARASPGNIGMVEEYLTDVDHSPVVVSVRIGPPLKHQAIQSSTATVMPMDKSEAGVLVVGAAYADASARTLGTSEFIDNDLFSNFESFCIQVSAREILLPASCPHTPKLKQVAERLGCVVTELKVKEWTNSTILYDLTRLLGMDSPNAVTQSFPSLASHFYSPQSLRVLITYLELMDESNFGAFELHLHDLSQYLRLDAAAVRALNLIPEGGTKTTSLLGTLGSNLKTSQGWRSMARWMKQPSVHLPTIQNRLNLVQCLFDDFGTRGNVASHLRSVPDLTRVVKRFNKKKASLEDVVVVYQVIHSLPSLLETLSSHAMLEPWSTELKCIVEELEKLEEMVETTIDLDATLRNEYLIRSDFDEALGDLREKMDGVRGEMEVEYDRVSSDLEAKVKFECRNPHGHHFRISKSESGVLKGKPYVELSLQKTGTLFTTTHLSSLDETYHDLKSEYEIRQKETAGEIMSVCISYSAVLEQLNELVAYMDVVQSLATHASSTPTPWVRPIVVEKGGKVEVKALRHPLLESNDYIPNNVTMEKGKNHFQIITGPSTFFLEG